MSRTVVNGEMSLRRLKLSIYEAVTPRGGGGGEGEEEKKKKKNKNKLKCVVKIPTYAYNSKHPVKLIQDDLL